MKYINRLNAEQIGELMRCYAPSYTDIEITINKKANTDEIISVHIELMVDELPESYCIEDDYHVSVYDWDDSNGEELTLFRKKMLEYFGNEYAVDFLLGNY